MNALHLSNSPVAEQCFVWIVLSFGQDSIKDICVSPNFSKTWYIDEICLLSKMYTSNFCYFWKDCKLCYSANICNTWNDIFMYDVAKHGAEVQIFETLQTFKRLIYCVFNQFSVLSFKCSLFQPHCMALKNLSKIELFLNFRWR